MSNFKFLQDKKEYQLFAAAAVEAERIYYSSPAMCAVGCRKTLDLKFIQGEKCGHMTAFFLTGENF